MRVSRESEEVKSEKKKRRRCVIINDTKWLLKEEKEESGLKLFFMDKFYQRALICVRNQSLVYSREAFFQYRLYFISHY